MKFYAFYSITILCLIDATYGRVIDASPSFFHSITTSRSRQDISNRYREINPAQIKADLDNSYTHGRHSPQEYRPTDRAGHNHNHNQNQIYNTGDESNSGGESNNRDIDTSQDDGYIRSSASSTSASIETSTSTSTTESSTTSTSTTSSTVTPVSTSCNKLINVKANILDTALALCLL